MACRLTVIKFSKRGKETIFDKGIFFTGQRVERKPIEAINNLGFLLNKGCGQFPLSVCERNNRTNRTKSQKFEIRATKPFHSACQV